MEIQQLDFKVEHHFLKNRLKNLQRFTCLQEKEALLLGDEEIDFKLIYNVLSNDSELQPINDLEAIAFIIEMSKNSVSDIFNLMYECVNCNLMNEAIIDLEQIINLDFDSDIPIGLFETPDDIINNSDSLIVKDYNELQELINENNKKILSLEHTDKCRSCRFENTHAITPLKFISKVSLSGFYEETFALTYYSHISLNDINNLYPFERELYLGITKKKLEAQPQLGGV
jgi:hypothetical protein